MKITLNNLRQLIKEVLSEQKPIPSYDGADPQNLFREITRDYDIFVTKEDIHKYGADGIAETMDGKYKMEYGLRSRSGDTWFEFTGAGADEWFNAGSGGHSYEWQRETIDKVLKYLESYKKQMNEQRHVVPLEDKDWMEKIIADYNLVPETQLPNGKIISASTLDGKYFLVHSSKGTMLSRGNLPPRERRKSENRLVLILPSESPKKINQKMARISKYLKEYSR